MRFFTRMFAGQSLVSWVLQIIFIYLAWKVADHQIPNNLTTIIGAAVLVVLTYISLAHDGKSRANKK